MVPHIHKATHDEASISNVKRPYSRNTHQGAFGLSVLPEPDGYSLDFSNSPNSHGHSRILMLLDLD